MHEFLLYSQIPAARHEQVLQILAGITAAQPIKFSEQHVVYQQIKGAQTAAPKKGQAAQLPRAAQLSYCKLVRDCSQVRDSGPWKIRKEEQPFAGVNDAISRTVAEHVGDEAELERFQPESEWYRYVSGYELRPKASLKTSGA
jgi:mediator of RNA polymerase II transcription subunit 18, fungi type